MIRRRTLLLSLALTPLLLGALAACKGAEKPAEDAKAMGEVLPGSASDAMIPMDTVRSQAPLAPPPTASAKAGPGRKGAAEGEEDAGDAEAGSEEAPAVSIPAPSQAAE